MTEVKFFIVQTQNDNQTYIGWSDSEIEAIRNRDIIVKKYIEEQRKTPDTCHKYYTCNEDGVIYIYKQATGTVFNGFIFQVCSFSINKCEKLIL